jgi:site-specific DNA recombinase
MYSEGYGYSEILNTLHEKRYKTKNGQDFLKNSLYTILNNPKYQGIYVFNRSSAKDCEGKRNTHKYKDYEDIIGGAE